MANMDKVHTFEEVKKHSSKSDCWIILFGKVYDITKFLLQHPGGENVLLDVTGKDATEDFNDIGHSYRAKDYMTKYYIGTIDISTIPPKQKKVSSPPKVNAPTKKSSGGSINMLLIILIPLFILGIALSYQKFGKSD